METTRMNHETTWEAAKSRLHDVYTDLSECTLALKYLSNNLGNQAMNDDLENIGGKAGPLDRKRVVQDQYAIGYLIRCVALGINAQAEEVNQAWIEYDNTKEGM
jgi:hypothetical protein